MVPLAFESENDEPISSRNTVIVAGIHKRNMISPIWSDRNRDQKPFKVAFERMQPVAREI